MASPSYNPSFIPALAWFQLPGYKEDPTQLDHRLRPLQETGDVYKSYAGFSREDRDGVVWVTLWKSYEAYERHESSQGSFETAANFSSPPKTAVVHLHPDDSKEDYYKALEAPVTSFTEIVIKPECLDKRDEFTVVANEMFKELRSNKDCVGAARTRHVKDDKVLMSVVGWTSAEAHLNALKDGNRLGELAKEVQKYTDLKLLKHASLSVVPPA